MKKTLSLLSTLTLNCVMVLTLLPIVAVAEKAEPLRIVAIGGTITEILYDLGVEKQLVGIDQTSVYPAATNKVPKVGYIRQLAVEGILALNPNLVLYSAEAGPPNVIDQLELTEIEMQRFATNQTVDQVLLNIQQLGALVGREQKANAIVKRIQKQQQKLKKKTTKIKKQKTVLFVMQHGNVPLVAGLETAANNIIALAGAKNAISEFSRYKLLTPEAVVNVNPDYILTTDLTIRSIGGIEKFKQLAGVSLTTAAKQDNIIVMETLFLLGFTPRVIDAATTIYQTVYSN